MVSQRSKRRFSKSQSRNASHSVPRFARSGALRAPLRTPAFETLNAEESTTRLHLIEKVKNAFYISGMALAQLKEERLYRNTHLNFDQFCQDIFGYSSDYAYLKIATAKVYQNLLDCTSLPPETPTNGRQPILPTRQRQLRPIVKAKLDADAQVEVWQMAIAIADGKIPSGSIVSEAVNLYLAEDDTQFNPFTEGEVCQIVVRGNHQLKGLGGSWCIIESAQDGHCIVNTWNNQLSVPIDNLESRNFNEEEDRSIEEVGVRMTALHQTGKLDDAALWVLNGLAKLDKSELSPLEEKLLLVIEETYGTI